MKELKIVDYEGMKVVDSREVAKAVGKPHNDLMKDIRRYITYLNEGDFSLVEFFVESSYLDNKGEERPCYQITKKGCEMIANKMTGKKGVQFTATYVNAFNIMLEESKQDKVLEGKNEAPIGEVASYAKVMERVMKNQNSDPCDIAEAFETISKQFGIVLPKNFVKKQHHEQMTMTLSLKEKSTCNIVLTD